jgi:putative copper resistance protein D
MTWLSPLQWTATVLSNASLAWMTGAFFTRLWLENFGANWANKALGRLDSSVIAACIICVASSFAALWLAAAAIGDTALWSAGEAFSALLATTAYGHAGLVGIGILLLLGTTQLLYEKFYRRRLNDLLSGALLLAFMLSRVTVSHAAESGLASVPAIVDCLHLLLTSTWLGLVMVSAWLVLPNPEFQRKSDRREMNNYLASLSRTATIALGGIVLTGAYNAYRGIGAPHNLVSTFYGIVLSGKLCLVLLAVGLGAFNRFIGFPAVVSPVVREKSLPPATWRVMTVLRIESVVLLGALAIATVLSSEAPPGVSDKARGALPESGKSSQACCQSTSLRDAPLNARQGD